MHYFQSTKFKLLIAKLIFTLISLIRLKQVRTIKRNQINFEIDIKEGIDLSLFLFGSFQKYIWDNKFLKFPNNPVIFDVGANIGSIALNLARSYPDSLVYCFEPTNYAYQKLLKNISLNPDISEKIIPIQAFLGETEKKSDRDKAYSSWKIDGTKSDHPLHGGIEQSATEIQLSIDSVIESYKITKVDFIKIDVDGFELDVLSGAKKCLIAFRPIIVFEFMGHSGESIDIEFKKFNDFFNKHNYMLLESKTKKKITLTNINTIVPPAGGIDILCLPN
jgi:FkbM family methyltransferase